jgi:hypothetical protein
MVAEREPMTEVAALREELEELRRLVDQLQPDLPRFGRTDYQREIGGMRNNVTGRHLLTRGQLVVPLGTAARTDAAAHGQVNHYITGSTIVEQIRDADAAAWRTSTFS